jgi:hypothetical protein
MQASTGGCNTAPIEDHDSYLVGMHRSLVDKLWRIIRDVLGRKSDL